jgi:hypothetical protein
MKTNDKEKREISTTRFALYVVLWFIAVFVLAVGVVIMELWA